MSVMCIVCNKINAKYKCPKCYFPFCSVNCGQTHKDSPNCKSNDLPNETPSAEENNESASLLTPNTVPLEALNELKHDKKVQEMLKDRRIQEIFTTIHASENPDNALNEAMRDPQFRSVVEAIFDKVDPHVKSDTS